MKQLPSQVKESIQFLSTLNSKNIDPISSKGFDEKASKNPLLLFSTLRYLHHHSQETSNVEKKSLDKLKNFTQLNKVLDKKYIKINHLINYTLGKDQKQLVTVDSSKKGLTVSIDPKQLKNDTLQASELLKRLPPLKNKSKQTLELNVNGSQKVTKLLSSYLNKETFSSINSLSGVPAGDPAESRPSGAPKSLGISDENAFSESEKSTNASSISTGENSPAGTADSLSTKELFSLYQAGKTLENKGGSNRLSKFMKKVIEDRLPIFKLADSNEFKNIKDWKEVAPKNLGEDLHHLLSMDLISNQENFNLVERFTNLLRNDKQGGKLIPQLHSELFSKPLPKQVDGPKFLELLINKCDFKYGQLRTDGEKSKVLNIYKNASKEQQKLFLTKFAIEAQVDLNFTLTGSEFQSFFSATKDKEAALEILNKCTSLIENSSSRIFRYVNKGDFLSNFLLAPPEKEQAPLLHKMSRDKEIPFNLKSYDSEWKRSVCRIYLDRKGISDKQKTELFNWMTQDPKGLKELVEANPDGSSIKEDIADLLQEKYEGWKNDKNTEDKTYFQSAANTWPEMKTLVLQRARIKK